MTKNDPDVGHISLEVLNVRETAHLLRCGPKAVRRLVRLKRLRAVVIDRKGTLRIPRAAIETFLLGKEAVR